MDRCLSDCVMLIEPRGPAVTRLKAGTRSFSWFKCDVWVLTTEFIRDVPQTAPPHEPCVNIWPHLLHRSSSNRWCHMMLLETDEEKVRALGATSLICAEFNHERSRL